MAKKDHRRAFLSQNLSRARGRKDGKQITIDVDYLFQLGETQGWKCALTGHDLQFQRGGTLYRKMWMNAYSCSIDRIDTAKDYVPGNVHLVCAAINHMKAIYSVDELVGFAKAIVEYNKPVVTGQLTLPGFDLPVETYSARAAAKMVGKSKDTIRNAIKKGKLSATRVGRRFGITKRDLEQAFS